MKIFKITCEYEEEAKTLVLEGLKDRWGFIDESYNLDLNNIVQTYDIDGGIFLIGKLGDETVCTGAFTKEDSVTCQIKRVPVKKNYRRNGFAKSIVLELERHAKDMGYKRIVLETTNTWASAIEFYIKNGYIECLNDDHDIYFYKEIG